MVPGENHRFLANGTSALVSLDLPFRHLQVHEALQDVHQTVLLEHLIPEVMSLPIIFYGRIPGTVIMTPVKRQKLRILAL